MAKGSEIGWDDRQETVVARTSVRLGAIMLEERPLSPGPDVLVAGMVEGVRRLGLSALPWNEASLGIRARAEWYDAYAAKTVLQRWAKPEELGGAVVFLASDAAAYVNGHVLAVDGGLSVTM